MGKKYKVEQDGQFLGHHRANTPQQAVEKALSTYGPFYSININNSFKVSRGQQNFNVLMEG